MAAAPSSQEVAEILETYVDEDKIHFRTQSGDDTIKLYSFGPHLVRIVTENHGQ